MQEEVLQSIGTRERSDCGALNGKKATQKIWDVTEIANEENLKANKYLE
jgi:hypothetical protein